MSFEVSQRRMGAGRPTRVQPRPQSAQDSLRAARHSPAFAAELDKFTRARIEAHLSRSHKRQGSAVAQCFVD